MFPIRDSIPTRHVPWVTWVIIAANVFLFLMELRLPEHRLQELMYLFGLVPARYTHTAWARQVGFPSTYWPFVTSMFLHGGWLHIISNMWTLWIFGDNVEDRMGAIRYLLFYLTCGVFAAIVHAVTNADSLVPTIGASGAVAGVLGAYFLLYPHARVLTLVPIIIIVTFINLPAYLFLALWFLMQLVSGAATLGGPERVSGIAWWAHVGGFVAGLVLCALFVRGPLREPRAQTPEEAATYPARGYPGRGRAW